MVSYPLIPECQNPSFMTLLLVYGEVGQLRVNLGIMWPWSLDGMWHCSWANASLWEESGWLAEQEPPSVQCFSGDSPDQPSIPASVNKVATRRELLLKASYGSAGVLTPAALPAPGFSSTKRR
jgi:hypothetical protein